MKTFFRSRYPVNFGIGVVCLGCAIYTFSAIAETASPGISAPDLAARLSAIQQDGSSYVRLRLEVKQPPGTTKFVLQVQIKERRTKTGSEVVYQVLWPKERKGEAVLLRKPLNQAPIGSLFVPPDTVRSLAATQMRGPLFGSDVTYEDALENFFAWEKQAIVGTEVINRVNCQILESTPGRSDRSSYARVRTWVDSRRMLPLRIEKYLASGQLACRIDTTNVATDDNHRPVPAELTVRGQQQNSVTELAGSGIRHDVTYADREFTPDGLRELRSPQSAPK
jgi:hypothetical protein